MDALTAHGIAHLLKPGDVSVGVREALEGFDYVLLYFSAKWCKPCAEFVEKLKKFYNAAKERHGGPRVEVVYVSNDKTAEQFAENFATMPWTAVRFSDEAARAALNAQYKGSGIPRLFVLGKDGAVINAEGREALEDDVDTNFLGFPWKRQSVLELVAGGGFTAASDVAGAGALVREIDAEFVAVYFTGAFWAPCKKFTPLLKAFYEKVNETKPAAGSRFRTRLEVVAVSWDRDHALFLDDMRDLPWLAVPWSDCRRSPLCAPPGYDAIPTLVLLDNETKTVISEGARDLVLRDPDATKFPWPKGLPIAEPCSLENLFEELIDAFEQRPTVALNANDVPITTELQTALCEAKNKASGVPPNLLLLITEPRKPRESRNHCPQGHEMTHDTKRDQLTCDCCREPAFPSHGCRDCDFDLCVPCYEKNAAPINRSQGILRQIQRLTAGDDAVGPKQLTASGLELCFFDMKKTKWHSAAVTDTSVDALAAQISAGLRQIVA